MNDAEALEYCSRRSDLTFWVGVAHSTLGFALAFVGGWGWWHLLLAMVGAIGGVAWMFRSLHWWARAREYLDRVERSTATKAKSFTFVRREFVECPTCIAKPGAPDLCRECLERRELHWRFRDEIAANFFGYDSEERSS